MIFLFSVILSLICLTTGCLVNNSHLNGKGSNNQGTDYAASQGSDTSNSHSDTGINNESASEPDKQNEETNSSKEPTESQITEQGSDTSNSHSDTGINNESASEPDKQNEETNSSKEPTEPKITQKAQISPTPVLLQPDSSETPAHGSEKEKIVIVAISAGKNHAAAIDDKGVLYTWGQNNYGQLGDGTTTDRSEPKPVPGITSAKSVACGWRNTYVLCEDGLVYSFGEGFIGRDYGENAIPVSIKELSDIIAIDTNSYENIALKSDGTVYDWGTNSRRGIHELPERVEELEDIVSVAVGNSYYLAVDKNGEVWAWGSNKYLNLNTGNTEPSIYLPSKVQDINNVKSSCGDGNEILGLHYDGNVTRWGDYKQEVIIDSKDVVSIHSGDAHFLAVKKDGTVFSWGINMHGELGNRTAEDQYEPRIIEGLSGVIAADGGTDFSMVLKEDGTVWAWGKNDYGQLGIGNTENQLEPRQIIFPSSE